MNRALTFLEVLSLPPLNEAEVVAGRSAIRRRRVERIDILHWPADEFARPGTLVLTTGVAPDVAKAEEFLRRVIEINVAAVIVSPAPGIGIEKVVDAVAAQADESAVPLLTIAWGIPFADAIATVHSALRRGARRSETVGPGLLQRDETSSTDAGVSAELARALALRSEAVNVDVAMGRDAGGDAPGAALGRTLGELHRAANALSIDLRICVRGDLALAVLERRPGQLGLADLIGASRSRAQDRESHWVFSDTAESATQEVNRGRDIIRLAPPWAASQSLESLFVLGALAESPAMSPVVVEAVRPLIDYDRQHRRNLMETLEVFLDQSCNTTVAARVLFLNRHSLMYRIKKIEELTGFSLKEPADRFFLQASVRLYHYQLVGEHGSDEQP